MVKTEKLRAAARKLVPSRADVMRGVIYTGVLLASTGLIGATIAFSAQSAGSMMVVKSAARQEIRKSYAMPLPEKRGADFNIARATAAVVKAPPATLIAASATTEAAPAAREPSRPHRVTASSLNIRSRPGQGRTLFSLPQGTVVEVAEASGNWLEITGPDGRSGWAFARYLEPQAAR